MRFLFLAVLCVGCGKDSRDRAQCERMLSWAVSAADSAQIILQPPNGISLPCNRILLRNEHVR